MAIRTIRLDGDDILRKRAKEVEKVDHKIVQLLEDMAQTMYDSDGVGLAAPQVGILRRVIVVDAGDGLIELVNPVIISFEGEQLKVEGCLSVPEVYGEVKRPATVVVQALDRHGKSFEVRGEELLAIALCHEIDHLDGILFKDKVVNFIEKEQISKRKQK